MLASRSLSLVLAVLACASALCAQGSVAEVERLRLLRRAVDRWAVRLASESPERRYEALCALIRIGLGEGDRAFAEKAVSAYEHYGALYERRARERRSALLELRPTVASVVGVRRFTTSLGFGAPVTLELPTVRRASVRSTVAVPLGR
jgi:hypothetical protein